VTCLEEDKKGNFWVGTYGGGLNRLDKGKRGFAHFRHNARGDNSLADDRVNTIYEDKKGDLWLGTEAGLDLFNTKNNSFTLCPDLSSTSSPHAINIIQEDRQGNLWLGTKDDGLYLFDPAQRTITRFSHSDKDPASLGNNMIKTILVDKKGWLWIGSRSPTASGARTARDFAAFLARAGLTITSGLAIGIDAAAHAGALVGGGRTIAVLGSGLDQLYPPENTGLADRIVAQGGALLTEFPPGTAPLRSNFPRRNRLFSGLSLGTLVYATLLTLRFLRLANRFAAP